MTLLVRNATETDGAACADIYAPYVTDTSISFESVPPTPALMARRITHYAASHAWLVAEDDGQIAGYAYAHPFSERDAYRWSCETSIYVAPDARGRGVGRALYRDLLDRVASRGYLRAFAGVTLPNAASIALHRAFGFEACGVYRRVGYKFGRWHDVGWFQRDLGVEADPPAEPR